MFTETHTRICVFFFMFSHFCNSQNLIPDSSFENNKAVPMDFSAIHLSHFWNAPTRGTTDLFCVCTKKTKLFSQKIYSSVEVPQNPMGYQHARSGTCYAGFYAFSHGNYREYIQTTLKEPLEKNKTYLFTMYLSLADYSRARVDQLGVCFLKDKAHYTSTDRIEDLKPSYINIDSKIGRDVEHWHPLTLIYKAQGGESFLLIGGFEIYTLKRMRAKVPKEIKPMINQNSARNSYYFIDDVSLIEIFPPEDTEPSFRKETGLSGTNPQATRFASKSVLFETNKSVLLPSSFPELDTLANYLAKNPLLDIAISGHTDNSGNENLNQALSLARAKAILEYLLKKEISPRRLSCKGYGSSKPLCPNDTEEHKRQNRRVEFILE